jgi:hypothetical protein
MRKSVKRIAALMAVITVVGAFPAAAGAATTMGPTLGLATITVSVGEAKLTQKVIVNVPVTVTCTLNPGAPADYPQQGSFLEVNIVQAVGQKTTAGSAFASGFACDGAPHTYAMQILAGPAQGGLHFRKGQAAIVAEAGVNGYDANFNFGGDSASTGWIGLRIR